MKSYKRVVATADKGVLTTFLHCCLCIYTNTVYLLSFVRNCSQVDFNAARSYSQPRQEDFVSSVQVVAAFSLSFTDTVVCLDL